MQTLYKLMQAKPKLPIYIYVGKLNFLKFFKEKYKAIKYKNIIIF